MSASTSEYLLGYSDHERRRLVLQAAVLNPLTEGFLVRAGVGPGMRVLDLGCGVGEVALLAARLVGPQGHVTAIDLDPAALEISRARAAAAGITPEFRTGRFTAGPRASSRCFAMPASPMCRAGRNSFWMAGPIARSMNGSRKACGASCRSWKRWALRAQVKSTRTHFSDRLRQEALGVGGCLASPVVVCTFGRKPS